MTGYEYAVKDGVVARLLPPECAFLETVSLNMRDQTT
jgi:hypothetical protein